MADHQSPPLPPGGCHICLISDQNVAEFLGAFLPGCAASRVHAITTAKMRQNAVNFSRTCKGRGIGCDIHELAETGMEQIHALLDRIWQPGASWVVNITGGTKLMSLAAFTWASAHDVPACYVDSAAQKLIVHSHGAWESHPLPEMAGFEALLNLYGYEVVSRRKEPVPAQTRAAFERMLALADSAHGRRALHVLNARATQADAGEPCPPDVHLLDLLNICRDAGKLDFGKSGILFRDEAAKFWCKGGWLEEYVQAVLARLESEGRISSCASSVRLARGDVKNELDAVFTARNRLHIIECKTSRLGAASTILYKADSIRGRVAGIYTRSMLCSLDSPGPEEMKRASALGIRTVSGSSLKNLRKVIIEWIMKP